MRYRLGLDVGTASCGLVALGLDENSNPLRPVYDSLDIWQEPLSPAKSGGIGEPKKAARRRARQARRLIGRRARRLRRIAHLASLLGFNPSTIAPDNGQNIHRLRAQAADSRVELADLLRILLHLAKNRGPSGDWVYTEPKTKQAAKERKGRGKRVAGETATTDDATPEDPDKQAAKEKKNIVGGVRKLEELMQEAAKELGKQEITLGQYLNYRRQKGESVILGRKNGNSIPLYPSRRVVEHEFDRIWDTQAQFHPVMQDMKIRDQFHNAIFFQRPLKSPAPMVGRCPLEPTLPRSPAAQMAAQAFRIEKQISDLRWGMGRRQQRLSQEQKDIIRSLLEDSEHLTEKGELSFKKLLKVLEEQKHPGPTGLGLNMDRSSRESLKGNTTLAVFRKLDLETEWKALDERTQIQVINFLADLGSPEALDNDDWHLKFLKLERECTKRKYKKPIRLNKKQWKFKNRSFDRPFVEFINRFRKHEKFGRLSAMGFDGGRMAYSIKTLKALTQLLQTGADKDGVAIDDERAAVDSAYPKHNQSKALSSVLPLPEETGNTVADVALRQVYRAVRRAMETLGGPPTQIIVELSRDMALGIKKRGEIEKKINTNKKTRRDAANAISEHGEQVTDKKIDRYLLWEQQMHYCPYCDRRIELGEALGSETEREHILPRTLTRVGGKRSQLVLAHKSCNNEKGNRTPWQAFHSNETRWPIIKQHAELLRDKKQFSKAKLLELEGWEDEVLDDDAIKGFTDRQFHESAWIAKLTALWLRRVCSDVMVSRGELTAHLRRIWKLDTVIPEVRYASSLPVLDRDGKRISREDFNTHKSWWEGHNQTAGGVPTDRKPDKRIDHRHHLVDALVITLSDRRLFRKMAENYKREREKEKKGERAKLGLYEEPPIKTLRELAVEIVTNAKIRHKPDRYPDGPLFDQTAYGISRKPNVNGKHVLANSKLLIALIDNKGSVEKTRKVLERIESEVTRNAVLEAFEKRIVGGTSLKRIFDDPILHPQFHTPIRRVRLLGNSEDTAATIAFTNRHNQRLEKRYPSAGNAYLELRVENGKLIEKPRLVTIQEAMRESVIQDPVGVIRFWKGDTVRLGDGSLHLIGIIAAQGGGQLRLVPVTETCTFGELKKRGLTMRTISGEALSQVTLADV